MPRGHFRGYRSTTPEARFWKRVLITDGCWEWQGYCAKVIGHPELRGHGQMRLDAHAVGVHCFSWVLHHGPIPKGLCVCHRCDNPPCVRPDHLFLGTHKDNMQDALQKNRLVRGEATCTAILTEAQVREIRTVSLYNRTESYATIGHQYGVNEATIRAVVHRVNWKWVE